MPESATVGNRLNGSQEVATYDYHDERGTLLFQVVRLEPGDNGATKTFRQRRPDGRGGWIWGLSDTRRVLYRLPELLASFPEQWVFIPEGEKDVDNLRELDIVATTNPMGALKWRPEYAESLRDRNVAIVPDNDEPGKNHAKEVAQSLRGKAKSVTILELPGLPPKGDVSDWLGQGNDKTALYDLLKLAVEAKAKEHGDAWEGEPASSEELGILLSTVQPERVEWLWPGRIPLGKLTITDGDPGVGKSVLSLDIAARVSRGMAMPDGAPGRMGGVVILSAEDGLRDTIRPRLDAAGANCERILFLDSVPAPGGEGKEKRLPILPDDVPYIQAAVERMKAIFVLIDPVTAFLGSDINAHKDADCRRALFPLANMAEKTGAAVDVIRHLNKGNSSNPLYRGGGSIGIIGAARSGLLVAKDPENPDKRVLAGTKCNLAKLPPSLAFDLSQAPNGALHIGWQGESSHTAQSLLAIPKDDEERTAVQEAVDVLRTLLAGGGRPADDVRREARKAGVADVTLRRTKAILGVEARLVGFGRDGKWYWNLPEALNSTEMSASGLEAPL
jgi:hypothetical protein